MTINNLGTYGTLAELWESYPRGGIEGDYAHIGDVLYVWDKYLMGWREATDVDLEGGEVTKSTYSKEAIAGYNYYGSFDSLDSVWSAYPQGGIEGCYVNIGEAVYLWDKYSSNWVLTKEEDLITPTADYDNAESTYKLVVCIGRFDNIEEAWKAYPTGGIEGTYIFIGDDKYRWDKYTNRWAIATDIESSQIRPIVDFSQEGVVEYSDNYINYLGSFESIEQAWEVYPEGGRDGDYILVAGEQLKWNRYTNSWGELDNGATSPIRAVATVYGDLHVFNDVIVGDRLIATILDKLATKIAISKITPQRVESEEMMQSMIDSGNYVEGQIYYVPEE